MNYDEYHWNAYYAWPDPHYRLEGENRRPLSREELEGLIAKCQYMLDLETDDVRQEHIAEYNQHRVVAERESRRVAEEGRTKAALRPIVLARQNYRCADCGIEERATTRRLSLHRLVPGNVGGMYTEDNVVALCSHCHNRQVPR